MRHQKSGRKFGRKADHRKALWSTMVSNLITHERIETTDTKAKELGLTPLARIVATAATGLSPEIMGLGPIQAVRKVLRTAGMSISDIDLFEINEAFAVQVLGSAAELGIDHDKLNVSGGAIAIGHPFGMTGARITTTDRKSVV